MATAMSGGMPRRPLHREWRDLPDPSSLVPRSAASNVAALPAPQPTGMRRALAGLDLYRSSVREILVGAAEYAASRATDATQPRPTSDIQALEMLMDRATTVKLTEDGSPWFPEDVVDEFGCAMGWSLRTATAWLRDAVELAWRLPATWQALTRGGLDPFRARHLARLTSSCSLHVASEVDRLVGSRLASLSRRYVERLVLEVSARVDGLAPAGESSRNVEFFHPGGADASFVEASMDAGDAKALEETVARLAAHLAALGDGDDLGVRRSKALGVLASPAQALELLEMTPGQVRAAAEDAGVSRIDPRLLTPHRQSTTIHVHVTDVALLSGDGVTDAVRLGDLAVRRVHELVGHSQVVIRPVIDAARVAGEQRYAPTADMVEVIRQRHRTCTFPYCTRASESCDLDHREPHPRVRDRAGRDRAGRDQPAGRDDPPPTRLDNLQPLCRHHHRLKTHLGWRCTLPDADHPTTIWWTSPDDRRYTTTPVATLPGHVPPEDD